MVKISVIVLVYNVEEYLERCLYSIVNQTFQDIEIICIDDGSSCCSLDILNRYTSYDSRIKVISQENHGAYVINKAIEVSQGEYLIFIDSDDWIEKDCLEKLYQNAIMNNSEIVLFNTIMYKGNIKYPEQIYLYLSSNHDNVAFDWGYDVNTLMKNKFIQCKLYKTSFLNDNNIKFNENIKFFEDIIFHIDSIVFAKKISYCYEMLYHSNKLIVSSKQTQDENYKYSLFDIFDYIEKILLENGFNNSFKLKFIQFKLLFSKENFIETKSYFKSKFYDMMRKEFIKMRLNHDVLEKLPLNLYQFYIYCINFKSYQQFDNFTKNINIDFKYINKKKLNEKLNNFNSIGINLKNESPLIIVSLTSFPERMYDLHYCLFSLLNQSLKPNKVILWLAEEQFPNKEKDIPFNVLKLKSNGLEIKWCNDLKSFKKLIPALKKYPNDYIVTADDDIYYPKDWLKNIWEAHKKYPNTIISSRSRKISFDESNNIQPYLTWKLNSEKQIPSYINFPTNGAGTLFYPNSLSKKVTDEKLALKLCASADDIWFWAMMILNKTKIYGIDHPMDKLCYINVAREINILNETTLWENNKMGQNDLQLRNILSCFPEILSILNIN